MRKVDPANVAKLVAADRGVRSQCANLIKIYDDSTMLMATSATRPIPEPVEIYKVGTESRPVPVKVDNSPDLLNYINGVSSSYMLEEMTDIQQRFKFFSGEYLFI